MHHRPTMTFSWLLGVAIVVTLIFGLIAAGRPDVSVSVKLDSSGRLSINGDDIGQTDRPALLTDATGRIALRLSLADLAIPQDLRGTPGENRRYLDQRSRIAAALRETGLTLRTADGRSYPVRLLPRRGYHLTPDAWVAILVGLVAFGVGAWVLVLRPGEAAARHFAMSGVALWVASLTIILAIHSNLATPGPVLWAQWQANRVSALVFAWSLVAIFSVYPARIMPAGGLALLAIILGLLGIAGPLDPWPDVAGTQLIALTGSVVLMFAMVIAQAALARHNPVHRASIAWVGTTLLLSSGLFTIVSFLPQMMGRPPLVGDSVAMSAFLLFYLALAIAITRYRMFDLGNWTLYIIRATIAVLLVLIADMALVYWAGGQWTLSLAALIAAVAWLPARARLLRIADRRRDANMMRLIRGANQIAFAIGPEKQAALWQDALQTQFEPLEIRPGAITGDLPCAIRDDGRILVLASPLGGDALVLGYAGRGNRLFDSNDLDMAGALHDLVQEMVRARQAYDRGAQEERARIARDLHDDVGARLLTGLHMADARLRPTLHAAMSDIRSIVSGLTGENVLLERLLAEMRYEAARRLEAARIELDWQVDEIDADLFLIDYRQHKALTSAFREIVSNVIRHAHARHFVVRIVVTGAMLDITASDDGVGFQPDHPAAKAQGHGLANLHRRMVEAGGRCDIQSRVGRTAIALRLPLAGRP